MMLRVVQILVLVAIFGNAIAIVVRKCCPVDHIFDTNSEICQENNQTWALDLFDDDPDVTWSIPVNYTSNEDFNLTCSYDEAQPITKITRESFYIESGNLVNRSQPGVKHRDFCLEQTPEGRTIAVTCPCSKGGVCVNVCCLGDQIFDDSVEDKNQTCVKAENATFLWKVDTSQHLFYAKMGYFPECSSEGKEFLNVENDLKHHEFEVMANGTLLIKYKKTKEWRDPKEYCVGKFKQSNESTPSRNVMVCKKDQTQIRRRAAIYVTLFVIGAIFLMATLVVHALVPNLRRSVQGLSLMAHCACMLPAHIALATAQIIGSSLTKMPCQILAYFCQFTLLGGFFWLNVICLDTANTFRSLKSMVRASVRCLELDYSAVLRTFLWYCVYAFGVPFTLMVVTLIVDHSVLDHTNTFKPNIGLSRCWFEDGYCFSSVCMASSELHSHAGLYSIICMK